MKRFFPKLLARCMFCMILFASGVNISVFGSSGELDFLKLSDPMFSIYRNYGFKCNYLLELFESGLGVALDQSNGDCAFDNTRKHPEHLLQSAINLRPHFDVEKECYTIKILIYLGALVQIRLILIPFMTIMSILLVVGLLSKHLMIYVLRIWYKMKNAAIIWA